MEATVSNCRVANEGSAKGEHTLEQVRSIEARRTAFVARFIVLRESKRSKAHRSIELMRWEPGTTAEDLAERIRVEFKRNGDSMGPVERDIRRALAHASRSLNHFINEYAQRSSLSFIEALVDYEKSNSLLFGGDEQPRTGGWRLPKELVKLIEKGDVKG